MNIEQESTNILQNTYKCNQKRVVIIGGGFAGMSIIKTLWKSEDFHITLVDKNNYNFFPPLIYQIATGVLEIPSISFPFRKLLRKYRNVQFHMAALEEVLPGENKIILSTGTMEYDYLVFATGAESNYFGMENIRKNAIPMKTLDDALHMRNTILQNIETASRTQDETERRKLLTIVVAGGGPTGVEIAGMLAEIKKNAYWKDYPELVHLEQEQKIYLVDGMSTLLTPMSQKSQQYTLDALTKLGVEVKLNTQVADFDKERVSFKDSSTIETRNLIWAAGITGVAFKGIPETAYGRGKRLLTDQYSRVKDFENIYAIGDISLVTDDPDYPNGHPQMAQPAIQQGENLASNLIALQNNKALKKFSYTDKGSMAIIGRNKAVADISKKTHFSGFIAWFIWVFVHLVSLINFRNKIRTLYNWSIAYLTKDHSLRFIIRPGKKI